MSFRFILKSQSKSVFLIALNTTKEIQRHKVLYALSAMVFFIMGVGMILGPLSLSEQKRLSINFSFTACHIGLILISVYFASVLISHELEKKTAIPLFVKPVSRTQFIIGKFLGLSLILFGVSFLLVLFVLFMHFIYSHIVTPVLFIAMAGIFIEALILSAWAFFFSSFTSSSFIVLVYSILMFIIGHSINGIVFFINKEDDVFVKWVVLALTRILPDFEKLNWRAHALYHDSLMKGELFFAFLYSFSWIIFLLIVTGIVFERRSLD